MPCPRTPLPTLSVAAVPAALTSLDKVHVLAVNTVSPSAAVPRRPGRRH